MAEAAEKAKVTALRKAGDRARRQRAGRRPRARRRAPARPVRDAQPAAAASRWALLAGGPLVLVVGIGWFWLTGGRYVSTDNAYVQADTVNVATDVAGWSSIEVQDNEPSRRARCCSRLDDSTYRTALGLGRGRPRHSPRRASRRSRRATPRAGRHRQGRGATSRFYEKEFQRVQSTWSTARHRRRRSSTPRPTTSRPRADQVTHDAAAARRHRGPARRRSGRADRAASAATWRRWRRATGRPRDLDHTVVRAPIDGIDGRRAVAAARRVPGGRPGGVRAGRHRPRLGRGEPEGDRPHLRAAGAGGRPSRSTPTRAAVWEGTVGQLSPASQSQFSLLPAQNTSGNWVKVVQRIPLRVRVETKPDEPPLRAGMSAEIEVDTGHRRHLRDLLAWL